MTKSLDEIYKLMSHDELVNENIDLITEIQRIQVDFQKLLASTDDVDAKYKSLLTSHLELQKKYFDLVCRVESPLESKFFINNFFYKLRNLFYQKKHLSLISSSGLFDECWYLSHYSDVAKSKGFSKQPMLHYLKVGGFEGRDPGPDFSSLDYIKTHPEILSYKINPLVHYLYLQKTL